MKWIIRQMLLIGLLALVPAVCAVLFHPRRPPFKFTVFMRETLWLDARPAKDFKKSHVPGAVLLNEDEWDRLLEGVLEAWRPGQPLVVYCDGKRCDDSHLVAKRLREAGIPRV